MAAATAAKKKATDDAEADAAAAALVWPTGGYDLFIPHLLVLMLVVYVLLIEGSILCSVRASMLRYRYEMHTFYALLTVYSWISLIEKVLIFPTIQNLILGTFRLMASPLLLNRKSLLQHILSIGRRGPPCGSQQ